MSTYFDQIAASITVNVSHSLSAVAVTFDGQLLPFPLLLISAEASNVPDADDVVVDVEPEGVELEELDPEFGRAAAVSNLDAGQVLGGT